MDEPSVLDYVKSKLTFWKPSTIQIPPPEQLANPINGKVDGEIAGQKLASQYPTGEVENNKSSILLKSFSLSSLLLVSGGLGSALIAQLLMEPPNRAWSAGLIIYCFAAILIGTAYFRRSILPVDLPTPEVNAVDLNIKFAGIFISIVLMVLTFLFFGRGNNDVPRFNILNTGLWLLSIGYLVWTFWLPHHTLASSLRQYIVRWWSAISARKISVTRWVLLILTVVALIFFFRFYRLDTVPAEMVSDHAEKLLDVSDVLNGELRVFFPRNTGREAFQFYWTALMIKVFKTGVSFMSLKLGTVLAGLVTLLYIYRLGKEIGNRWVALFAIFFAGVSYWANIQSRIGLRFPLYPFFLAPVLFHLIRGLQRGNRNDFIWAGLWLGVGLHGYTASRIVPLLVVVGIILFLLHNRESNRREFAFWGLIIIAIISLAVFMPLMRFAFDEPGLVAFRSMTRLGDLERPLPGPAWLIFIKNTWNALVMFFWDDGDVWVHSVVHRPALDVFSAALFFIGLVIVSMRYLRKRNWIDMFLLISIPILLLPSILSLAFPNENPNLNRTAGAYVPVFLILAVGFEALLTAVRRSLPVRAGTLAASTLGLILAIFVARNNYDLLFNKYDENFRNSSWNSSEMGSVISKFAGTFGKQEDAWVVAYPYWVDTRLVGINAGFPRRDTAINPDDLYKTLENTHAKLFLLNTQDLTSLGRLQDLYPDGRYWFYPAKTPGKEFVIFQVLPRENLLPVSDPTSP